MNLLNFLKKNKPTVEFTYEDCHKLQQRGQELTTLLHPQIEEILSKNYQKELESIHFLEKKTISGDVFEIACVGLSLVTLIDLVEKDKCTTDQVKKCLKNYQEVYAEINKNHIYNQLMKYIQDYKYFTESDAPAQIKEKEIILTCFTGAWVIRYYIGEEATIQFDTSIEIGNIIQETIKNIRTPKK